jgi:hypothetical protein
MQKSMPGLFSSCNSYPSGSSKWLHFVDANWQESQSVRERASDIFSMYSHLPSNQQEKLMKIRILKSMALSILCAYTCSLTAAPQAQPHLRPDVVAKKNLDAKIRYRSAEKGSKTTSQGSEKA